MSLQIFLQGHLQGIEAFLCAGDPAAQGRLINAYTIDAPARFLADRGLSPILLGSAGGGQFLLVLPETERVAAAEFFRDLAAEVARDSQGRLRLLFTATENLGAWKRIRERLDQELNAQAGALATAASFEPFIPAPDPSEGRPGLPVLRGDVDRFRHLIDRAESIEAHVTYSVLFRQFFEGEVTRLAADRAEILFLGGDEFAVAGDWQVLIDLGVELHRLFDRFIEENLAATPGPEGKTLSMALALPEPAETLASVFGRCGELLSDAKAITRDGFHLFGRTIDWKQAPEAASIKDHAVRLVKEFGCSTQFLDELRGFYPETELTGRKRIAKAERPWRYYRRLAVTLDPLERRARSREFEKVKEALANEIIGKNVGQARLRPTGRVALDWAQLLTKE